MNKMIKQSVDLNGTAQSFSPRLHCEAAGSQWVDLNEVFYFELITGIYPVIQGMVISSKQLDKRTHNGAACNARENC